MEYSAQIKGQYTLISYIFIHIFIQYTLISYILDTWCLRTSFLLPLIIFIQTKIFIYIVYLYIYIFVYLLHIYPSIRYLCISLHREQIVAICEFVGIVTAVPRSACVYTMLYLCVVSMDDVRFYIHYVNM